MRISDWSSDVCSSDLLWAPLASGAPKIAAIIGYISIATLLNAVGVRAGMAMVYVISILKLAPLILLIFVGFPHIEWAGVAGADIPGDRKSTRLNSSH